MAAQDSRVYVGNLDWKMSWQDLKDHMRAAGDVAHVEIYEDHYTGRSKGCALVEYKNAADAQKAITTLHDSTLGTRKIFVREDRIETPAKDQHTRVYVGNLDWDVSWQDLKDHMRKAGEVKFADIMENSYDGRSKGCAIVEYASADDAANAIETLNDSMLGKRMIFVREDHDAAKGKSKGRGKSYGKGKGYGKGGGYGGGSQQRLKVSESDAGCLLYVGNLPFSTSWQSLKDAFGAFGEVAHVEIAEDSYTGNSKGFALVLMKDEDSATKAIDEMHDSDFQGRNLVVRLDNKLAK